MIEILLTQVDIRDTMNLLELLTIKLIFLEGKL